MARNESNIDTQKLKNDLKQIGRKAGEKVKRTLSKTISDVLGDEKKSRSSSSRRKSKSSRSKQSNKGNPIRQAVLKAERGVRSGKSPGSVAREFVENGIGYSKKHSRSAKKTRSKKSAARRPSRRKNRIPVSKKAPRAEQSSRV